MTKLRRGLTVGVVKVKISLFFDERKKERKKVLQKFFLPSFDDRRNFQRSSFRSQTEFSLFFPFFKRKHKRKQLLLSALEVHYIYLKMMDVDDQQHHAHVQAKKKEPWVDKYRPKKVSDVAYQTEVVSALEKAMETHNLPHMLFYGPPGTGKTTCALAICKQLYGPELGKKRVLELNASDERGISVVRGKIKSFASTTVGEGVPGYPCPPYKILILDEADSMTNDAQSALRRMMETYSRVTRFFILCNYVSKIIDPISSRCAKFRFKSLDGGTMHERINFIAKGENLQLAEGTLQALEHVSAGDMRKAITLLQSAASLFGSELTGDRIREVAGVIPDEKIEELLQLCVAGDSQKSQALAEDILKDGFPCLQILEQFGYYLADSDLLEDEMKAEICLKLGEVEKKLVDGADEWLQLSHCISIATIVCSTKPEK